MNIFKRYGLFIASAFMALLFILTGISDEASAKKAVPKEVEKVTVKINGVTIENEGGYMKENGTMMIPLRAVSEALGYNVSYKQEAKMVELTRGAHWITVKLGEDSYGFGKMAPQKLGTIPEIIDGRTFVPSSFVTEILYLEMRQEGRNVINIISADSKELPFIVGLIASIENVTDGVKIELDNENSSEGYQKIFLITDNETTVINPLTNEKAAIENLKAGDRIRGFYGPVVAEVYPPQSYTNRIELIGDKAVKRNVITNIEEVGNDRYILVGTMENGVRLLMTADTSIVTSDNEPLLVEDLQVGMEVDAFYGPIQTMSLPPMSSAVKIIVLK